MDAVKLTEGPLLDLAGAGTGKTHVLAYSIAHILSQGLFKVASATHTADRFALPQQVA